MRTNYLHDCYSAKVIPLGTYGRFVQREVEEFKTIKECLWELAADEKADIMVVGNHGRKGPKGDETVCGSAIQYLSLNNRFPVLILKDYRPRSVKPDGCLRWGVCFD
jgi:nucleotide-binding universal stress UspA family protein